MLTLKVIRSEAAQLVSGSISLQGAAGSSFEFDSGNLHRLFPFKAEEQLTGPKQNKD